MQTRRPPCISLCCVLISITACGANDRDGAVNDDETCTPEDVIADLLEPGDVQDCGQLAASPAPSPADLANAQQCVLEAKAMDLPFRLIHEIQGIDSSVAQAYVWPGGDLDVVVLGYDSDPSGGNRVGGVVNGRKCRDFTATPDCVPSANDLCLTCVDGQDPQVYCDESQ